MFASVLVAILVSILIPLLTSASKSTLAAFSSNSLFISPTFSSTGVVLTVVTITAVATAAVATAAAAAAAFEFFSFSMRASDMIFSFSIFFLLSSLN